MIQARLMTILHSQSVDGILTDTELRFSQIYIIAFKTLPEVSLYPASESIAQRVLH